MFEFFSQILVVSQRKWGLLSSPLHL